MHFAFPSSKPLEYGKTLAECFKIWFGTDKKMGNEWGISEEPNSGSWLVFMEQDDIGVRFHSSKKAKLHIIEHLKLLMGSCVVPSLKIMCFQDFVRVTNFQEPSEDAVCVYFGSANFDYFKLPLGCGPMEGSRTVLHKMVPNWRWMFHQHWETYAHVALQSKTPLVRFIMQYNNNNDGFLFKQALCHSHPLRLVFVDKFGNSQWAHVWEKVRSIWCGRNIPDTIPSLNLVESVSFSQLPKYFDWRRFYGNGLSEMETKLMVDIREDSAKWLNEYNDKDMRNTYRKKKLDFYSHRNQLQCMDSLRISGISIVFMSDQGDAVIEC